MYQQIKRVVFPKPTDIMINMMPIIMGDDASVPEQYQAYLPLIDDVKFKRGSIVYLTINESFVGKGTTQRRPGVHTEATNGKTKAPMSFSFQGSNRFGGHGGKGLWSNEIYVDGLYMASTDGDCEIWNFDTEEVDCLGGVLESIKVPGDLCKPNVLYHLSDTTPHQALPAKEDHYRQFFRLVGPDLGLWWAKHNTANPLGVKPNAQIVYDTKFS